MTQFDDLKRLIVTTALTMLLVMFTGFYLILQWQKIDVNVSCGGMAYDKVAMK